MVRRKIIILFVCLLAAVGSVFPSALFGRVESFSGRLTRVSSSGEELLAAGDIILEQDVLQLDEGSLAVIRLSAGSVSVQGPCLFSLKDLSPPKETARVEYILGRLFLIEESGEIPLKAGEGLAVGDTIRTGDNSYAEISMSDKILLKMDKNTTLEIQAFEEKSKGIRQTLGRLWVKAKKLVAEKFEVETRFGTAGVRGTAFGVRLDAASGMEVECEEGEVYVRNPEGVEALLNAGFKRRVGADGIISEPETRTSQEGFEEFGEESVEVSAELREEYRRLMITGRELAASPDGAEIFFYIQDVARLREKVRSLDISSDDLDMKPLEERVSSFQQLQKEFERLTADALKKLVTLEQKFDPETFEALSREEDLIARFVNERNFPWEEYEAFEKRMIQLREKYRSDTDAKQESLVLSLLEQEIEKWEEKLNISGSAVDFHLLALNTARFQERYFGLTDELKQLNAKREADQLLKQAERLYNSLPLLKEIIAFEKGAFEQMARVRNRIFVFKQTLEAFSSQTDSAALWIEQAVNAVQTGQNLAQYEAQARMWDRLIREYEALRNTFSSYEKLVRDARQKGVFYTSPRILKEYDEMSRLLNNFSIKKGCCMVIMNFGQIRKELILIKNFLLTSEGRSLL